ncbi:MAG: polynucleotide adenylyltransferase [Verrucomicrobia bacterium RIFCSPLOWO2_12_FULL_64_8]|nr:MAG: polynucleotide adenylyltransferase [Verrucomicrobia bacterium RIFCSPLOWO2_12_FULL_64_8]
MRLPEELIAVLRAVRSVGRPRLVGGCVRDWLLGLEPKDFDVEVAGVDYEALVRRLAPFGATDLVGRSFGVIKLRLAGVEYDFSLPRRESKAGAGHRGFAVTPDPSLSDAEAAARRDFTLNAISYDPFADAIIDPHAGLADLRAHLLRHTSAAFVEDPLRVLRAMQFAARFAFELAPETARLCQQIVDTYRDLPVERVWGEWDKWGVKSTVPSRGLAVLEQSGWLVHFPEIAAMAGVPQEPEWHPEGDVLAHTRYCLDALAPLPEWQSSDAPRRRYLTFAVLAHDFGKPATTVRAERRGAQRWLSPGHEKAGGPLAENFLHRIGAPLGLADWVQPLVTHHLAHQHGREEFTDPAVRRLARKLAPATIEDLCCIMWADHLGRPPLVSSETEERIRLLREKAQTLAVREAAPKPLILGRHLLELGLSPGPTFKPVLDAGFEAQLAGIFTDEVGGKAWLRDYLHKNPVSRM